MARLLILAAARERAAGQARLRDTRFYHWWSAPRRLCVGSARRHARAAAGFSPDDCSACGASTAATPARVCLSAPRPAARPARAAQRAMFCALPVEPLLSALLLPPAPRRRIAVTLPAAHAALLEAAAAAHFRSRANAAARALLAHAMAGGGRGWAMAPRSAPCEEDPAAPPAEPVMVVLQVGALQHDWLAALGGEGGGGEGGGGEGGGCGRCGRCAAGAGGVDAVVARVLQGYAAMTPKGCEALLARLGEDAALRGRWDEKAAAAAVASPGAQSLKERLLA